MGYTKIVQYGDKVEVYNYEKSIYPKRHRIYKKRRYELNRAFRSERSVRRAILNFYRLCHHNNYRANSIHFLTITYSHDLPYKEACRHVARFMERIRSHSQKVPISFISVPELTKKGRYHFHLLVYNLPTEIAGDTISVRRYNRRKRQWQVEYATTRDLHAIFKDNSGKVISILVLPPTVQMVLQDIWPNIWPKPSTISKMKPRASITVAETLTKSQCTALIRSMRIWSTYIQEESLFGTVRI